MAVTIILSTLPASLTREDGWTSKKVEIFGRSLGRETLSTIRSVADIKDAVTAFGAKMRLEHQETSFYVSVTLAKGCRKPRGYDDATRTNGFGQDDFMHVTDKRTKPAPSKAHAVSILGLRLPGGYVADRHPDHIAVSLRGQRIGCLAHDIAPSELEAQVDSHHRAGGLGDLPRVGAVAVAGVSVLAGALS